jgi:hypothetical protein
LSNFLNHADLDIVARSRDVIANPIMREIAQEDPHGNSEYRDAVRHQVFATFQRVRLLLLVLDTLMEAYTTAI